MSADRPPGKTNYIGAPHPGAAPYKKLVAERFGLAQARDPDAFLARVSRYATEGAYKTWLKAYQSNAGAFLDHPVWGADRDLGGGRWLWGAMDDRFATNAARIFGTGGLRAADHVVGRRVCVIGAWDGTEALLLSALGAESVDSVDEAAESCEMARAQYDAWDVKGDVSRSSLYELDIRGTWSKYDLVYVPGVVYHLTDVVAALVITWAALRPGGTLAVESVVDPSGGRAARYVGASVPGWNWWSPGPECLTAAMRDCGFPDARLAETSGGRAWWVGTRGAALPALSAGAAGFSRPDILRAARELAAQGGGR